jgi:hypothetical protein
VENFDRNVFINCPFDKDFLPILEAMLFCIIFLKLNPLLATIRNDGAEIRLEKIKNLIKTSKFSIHDLSRSQARQRGEYSRMNMPFELGMDYGCRRFGGGRHAEKSMLILVEEKHRHQIFISDLAGFDVEAHETNHQKAVRKVRNWLCNNAKVEAPGAARILGKYEDFRGWHLERQRAKGFDVDDIQDTPTAELLDAMKQWCALGAPI